MGEPRIGTNGPTGVLRHKTENQRETAPKLCFSKLVKILEARIKNPVPSTSSSPKERQRNCDDSSVVGMSGGNRLSSGDKPARLPTIP